MLRNLFVATTRFNGTEAPVTKQPDLTQHLQGIQLLPARQLNRGYESGCSYAKSLEERKCADALEHPAPSIVITQPECFTAMQQRNHPVENVLLPSHVGVCGTWLARFYMAGKT